VLDIVFWILAIIAIVTALGVVLLKNVFRAAISLVFLFLIVAGIYITLHADFLAFVQILVYVGAIGILVIVGIMLTQDITRGNPTGKFRIPALIVSVLLFCTLTFTIVNTPWMISEFPPHEPTTALLGEKLFGTGGFLLPVEMIAVLLLTAILGAIVLMREK
jgi:NADH-quinone oxidoreductase subunit J